MKYSESDKFHIRAADGWLGLGDHLEANRELDEITPEARAHPDVLELRWEIFSRAENWAECIEIGFALVKLAPTRSNSWVHRSFALHVAGRTKEAFENLLTVADKFPSVWQVPYNLSCYCSMLGPFDEAATWFKRAMQVNEKIVQIAGIDDTDLKPLWDSMITTIWKRLISPNAPAKFPCRI